MKKVQSYQLSFKMKWFLAEKFFRYGLYILLGWTELETHLRPEMQEIDIKQTIRFSFPKLNKKK